MQIFIVVATTQYERGYDIVGVRFSRKEAEELVAAAKEGGYPLAAWESEYVRENCTIRFTMEMMDYTIHEVWAGTEVN